MDGLKQFLPFSENSKKILQQIRLGKQSTRALLSQHTNLSLPSITRAIAELAAAGFVDETKQDGARMGRKTSIVIPNPQAGYSIGVQIDHSFISVGIVNFNGELLGSQKIAISFYLKSARSALEVAYQESILLLNQLSIPYDNVLAVGIALPGIIDYHQGIEIFSPQLGWEGLPIASMAKDIFKVLAVADNDVKAYAYAESTCSIDAASTSSVLLYIGSGVGAALIQNGQVLRGSDNMAGEIGHAKIEPGGILCDCGRTGCLQTYMAEGAIIKRAKEKDPSITSAQEVIYFMEQGVAWATSIILDFINYTTVTIGLLDALYNPDIIICGGGFIDQNPTILAPIISRYQDTGYLPFRSMPPIQETKMKGEGTIYGVAVSAMDKFVDQLDQVEK